MTAAILNSMLTARANCEAAMTPCRIQQGEVHWICRVRHAISCWVCPPSQSNAALAGSGYDAGRSDRAFSTEREGGLSHQSRRPLLLRCTMRSLRSACPLRAGLRLQTTGILLSRASTPDSNFIRIVVFGFARPLTGT